MDNTHGPNNDPYGLGPPVGNDIAPEFRRQLKTDTELTDGRGTGAASPLEDGMRAAPPGGHRDAPLETAMQTPDDEIEADEAVEIPE